MKQKDRLLGLSFVSGVYVQVTKYKIKNKNHADCRFGTLTCQLIEWKSPRNDLSTDCAVWDSMCTELRNRFVV